MYGHCLLEWMMNCDASAMSTDIPHGWMAPPAGGGVLDWPVELDVCKQPPTQDTTAMVDDRRPTQPKLGGRDVSSSPIVWSSPFVSKLLLAGFR